MRMGASASWARRPRWRSKPRSARTSCSPSTSARRSTSSVTTPRARWSAPIAGRRAGRARSAPARDRRRGRHRPRGWRGHRQLRLRHAHAPRPPRDRARARAGLPLAPGPHEERPPDEPGTDRAGLPLPRLPRAHARLPPLPDACERVDREAAHHAAQPDLHGAAHARPARRDRRWRVRPRGGAAALRGGGRAVSAGATTPYWLDAPYDARAPLGADVDVEALVIGAGVGGLSCARRLAQHGVETLVLERGTVAGGASGRNGGFLLAGVAAFYPDARERHGPEVARRTYA